MKAHLILMQLVSISLSILVEAFINFERIELMDEKDLMIIEAIMKNGRISKMELARILGITEAAVRKRIAKLEENGIILGYKAIIDYKAAGFLASLTGIDVDPEKLWYVVEKLRDFDEIKSIWLTTGDHTIMTEILTKRTEELSKVHKEIEKIEGVRRVCPAIIINTLKF